MINNLTWSVKGKKKSRVSLHNPKSFTKFFKNIPPLHYHLLLCSRYIYVANLLQGCYRAQNTRGWILLSHLLPPQSLSHSLSLSRSSTHNILLPFPNVYCEVVNKIMSHASVFCVVEFPKWISFEHVRGKIYFHRWFLTAMLFTTSQHIVKIVFHRHHQKRLFFSFISVYHSQACYTTSTNNMAHHVCVCLFLCFAQYTGWKYPKTGSKYIGDRVFGKATCTNWSNRSLNIVNELFVFHRKYIYLISIDHYRWLQTMLL